MKKLGAFVPLLLVLIVPAAIWGSYAMAADAQQMQQAYEKQAGQAANSQRGQVFFTKTHGGDWSCATCHTAKPTVTGKHTITGRPIDPLAPSFNKERFTSERQTEKWFRRNCKDVLQRECTAIEKADVIAFLRTF
jgi:mono/diheme cytochrome c family protein